MKELEQLDIITALLHAVLSLRTTTLQPPYSNIAAIDGGISSSLGIGANYPHLLTAILKHIREKTVYFFSDALESNYAIIQLPSATASYVVIGPYMTQELDDTMYDDITARNHFTSQALISIRTYHASLPLISVERALSTVNTIATLLFGSETPFSIEVIPEAWKPNHSTYYPAPNPALSLSISVLEERYHWENKLMTSVAKGDKQAVVDAFHHFSGLKMLPRCDSPVRDMKNNAIRLNVLCRKAAEASAVHPVFLNDISERFSKHLEKLNTLQELSELSLDMLFQYCAMVQTHTMKKYSLPIRKATNYINFNLQLPLSLKSVAAQLNMNPNYLSTLYKKETGSTITDFINQARMRMALQLLNTDTMQVQAIAAFVGIDDVNYFSKLFKKTIGITPTAYRNIVQGKTQKSEILEKTSSFMSKMQNNGKLHSL